MTLVRLLDEEDSLSANESVTVVFGMTEEEIEQLQQRQSMQGRPEDVYKRQHLFHPPDLLSSGTARHSAAEAAGITTPGTTLGLSLIHILFLLQPMYHSNLPGASFSLHLE